MNGACNRPHHRPVRAAANQVQGSEPLLSVVIVTHHVLPLLRSCLRAVLASETPYAFEVFVVDTGSDGSAAVARREFPPIVAIEAPENPGYAAANNLALRRARGAYCLLLNPDTVVPPDGLAQTVAAMEADPSIGVLGPKLVRGDGSLDLACRRSFPTPQNALYHFLRLPRLAPFHPAFGQYNLTYRDPDEAYDVDAVTGAFMLLRREVLAQVGLLDETFWMYGEDLDLCWRSKVQGWRTRYHPAVCVVHLKGQSSKARSLRCTYEFFRAMHVFYRKYYAPRSSAAKNALITAGIVAIGAASVAIDRLRPPPLRRVS
ncbi:MAG: glycosyltransferase family 2 protein [Chloroflexi bacterium]|nr:glycosyltransferase family 2 protein [Chloroflexota bacterium]